MFTRFQKTGILDTRHMPYGYGFALAKLKTTSTELGVQPMSYKVIQPTNLTDGIGLNQLRNEVNTALDGGVKTILLDLQEVTFINSSAIGALVAMHKSAQGKGGTISLCSMRNQVSLVLQLSRMDQIFDIFADHQSFKQKNEISLI